jgi:predicted Zn-dependent protease
MGASAAGGRIVTTFDVGPRTFKAGAGTIRIGSPDSAEAKELAAQTAEFLANERKLSAIREDALREHYEEYVIVSNWGKKVRYCPTREDFSAAISAEESGAAAHAYLVEWPENLIV